MIYTLSNADLTVKINSKGAEMNSILDADGHQRLWQADSSIWGRHAPVLFPIVGRLKADQYTLAGHQYHMGQHGFARDMDFKSVYHDDTSLTMELKADAKTKKYYPYNFTLQLQYQLKANQIRINLKVINQENQLIWYSVGAHPGFKIPVNDDERYDDYQIQVTPAQTFDKINLKASYSDSHHPTKIDLTQPIPLKHALFTNDANILALHQQPTTIKIDRPNHHGVSLTVDDAPYVGIWSAYPKTGNFVCIEPWWGLADDVNADGKYQDKVAIQELPAHQVANHLFNITLF